MSKETILVVDDEEDILELVRFNLSREGFNIVCAASGEEAWKTLKTHQSSHQIVNHNRKLFFRIPAIPQSRLEVYQNRIELNT